LFWLAFAGPLRKGLVSEAEPNPVRAHPRRDE
jgi:hypothetical protein